MGIAETNISMKSNFALFSILILTACNHSTGQEARLIRWQLSEGSRYRVELKQSTAIKSSIDTREKQLGNEMLLLMSWKIESAKDDAFNITQSIDRVYLKISQPGKEGIQTTEIDTDNERGPGSFAGELLKQIQPLIGTKYLVSMTSRGEISEISVPPESMEALRNAPASMRLRQVLTREGLEDLIGQSAIVFPEQAIKAGDEWTTSQDITNALGKIRKTHRYVYNGEQDRNDAEAAGFSVSTVVEKLEPGENDATIDGFSGSGKIWFAPEENEILESSVENKMTTRRTYREKIIQTSVSSSISMRVSKIQ